MGDFRDHRRPVRLVNVFRCGRLSARSSDPGTKIRILSLTGPVILDLDRIYCDFPIGIDSAALGPMVDNIPTGGRHSPLGTPSI